MRAWRASIFQSPCSRLEISGRRVTRKISRCGIVTRALSSYQDLLLTGSIRRGIPCVGVICISAYLFDAILLLYSICVEVGFKCVRSSTFSNYHRVVRPLQRPVLGCLGDVFPAHSSNRVNTWTSSLCQRVLVLSARCGDRKRELCHEGDCQLSCRSVVRRQMISTTLIRVKRTRIEAAR
jgi:hypothetical protein